MAVYKKITEYGELKPQQFFSDIVPVQSPVVIRDFSAHWPLVDSAKKSPQAFCQYIGQFYHGEKARIFLAPPSENRRFYYNADFTGLNYISGEERIDLFLGRLLELAARDVYPAVSMQNAALDDLLPGLSAENATPFFPEVKPRLWIGNEGIVSAHYDGADNLACVIAGRRRFVLFPPDQTGNLYPGPLNFTPAGAPTSMVDLNNPDYERYPNFKIALANAYSVELGPGDAIFIPMLWWHHVESLEKVNGLMNYWWNGSSAPGSVAPTPIDSLNIALLAMRDLSPEQRNAWRHMFDHYLFKQGVDPVSYIPEHQLHVLGNMSPDYVSAVKEYFIEKFQKQ